ncbi:MAG: hypothetical protein EOO68_11210 [Moraxellaceae bacterium]|nr:MAG: hypothetical protein EOO68_11210 [Moraxellaceae bacterium]
MSFDSQGSAPITINYSDAGQINLLASLNLPAVTGANPQPAYTLTGSSNSFVVKPASLAVTAATTTADGPNPGTTASGVGFVSAGTPFKVLVAARNSLGAITPNFGREITPEIVNMTVASSVLNYPSGGTLSALTNTGTFSATTPAGTYVNSGISWNQVGTIAIAPLLTDNDDYLGAGKIDTYTSLPNVGRFYPDRYRLTSSSTTNGCGTFSYIGQPNISTSYVLQAESTTGAVLTNYGGNYGTAVSRALPSYAAENNNDGINLGSRFNLGATATWVSGLMTVASTAASFNRQPVTFAPEGPFSAMQLGLSVTDAFDGRALVARNMNAITTGTCTVDVNCTAATLGSTINLRYGRLRLDDAFGPESVKLPVTFLTEYWIGNRFVTNTSDSCTVIPRASITYPTGTLATDANRTVALSTGSTQGTYANINVSGVNFLSGTAGHEFTAPSTGGTGNFSVSINLAAMPWLCSDVNLDNNFSDTLLRANFGFGSYRGNDRVIYWRERF